MRYSQSEEGRAFIRKAAGPILEILSILCGKAVSTATR